jgi:hypothetical protein
MKSHIVIYTQYIESYSQYWWTDTICTKDQGTDFENSQHEDPVRRAPCQIQNHTRSFLFFFIKNEQRSHVFLFIKK